MTDESHRIQLAQLTEWFAAEQRKHHEQVLAATVAQIENLEIPAAFEGTRRALIEDCRALLAADLERCAREVSALAARGLRVDEMLH